MNRIFLIGGYDLEMKEIIDILKKNGEKYIDNNLSWGAKLSDYGQELEQINNDCVIYALELTKDIDFSKKIIFLDHHNENSSENSTLEQVADILKITLTREQRLIAENDKGYIAGLKAFGASQKEISEIRRADRKSQGVTDEDERLAKKSIIENKSENSDIIIVKSLTEKFSPVCDRLYPVEKLIIYTNNELSYYGKFSKELYEKYKKSYEVYSGGGENGYFGFEKGSLEIENIKNIIEEIIEYIQSNFSYHTFIFPFSIEEVHIEEKLKNSNWEKKIFEKEGLLDDEIPNYNEYMYFYENVRKVLYGNSPKEENSKYYEYSKNNLGDYVIKIKDDKVYKLKIKSICLRIFQNKIGILSFHLENSKYKNFKEILEINQYGRRVYSPYYSYDGNDVNLPTDLAQEIEITGLDVKTKFDKIKNELGKNRELDFIKNIIGKNIEIKPTLDDRMFVLCWCTTYLAEKIGKEINLKEQKYIDEWYKFVFIDTEFPSCQNRKMKKELVEKHSYERWSDYGTLYGISRYSFVCLLSSNIKILTNHMKTMYYQMLVLVFIQRISILNFKNEISELLLNEEIDFDKVEKLYQRYLEFINKICIREVTAQEQGIEIYKKLWEVMEVEKQSKELKKEIEELFNLSRFKLERKNQVEQDEINNKLNVITAIGGALAISGIAISLVDLKGKDASNSGLLFCIILTIILGGIFYVSIGKYDYEISKKKIYESLKRTNFLKFAILVIFILIVWVLIYP